MSDIHALSGAYAIDALDDVERARFERHLGECADCRAEVQSLREAGGLLAETSAAAPPPDLRARVLADITTVRPLPPVAVAGAGPARRTRPRLTGLVAAAAAVLAIGAGVAVAQPWADDSPRQTVSATDRVMHASDAQEMTQELPDGSEATVIRSRSMGAAVLITHDMPPPPSGKIYQVWLQNDAGEMVSAALMSHSSDEPVLLKGDAATATAAGITVEPAGGSEAPTTEPIALIPFENA